MKWQLVDRPVPGSVTLSLAIVKLKPTDVGGNIMSDLVSFFMVFIEFQNDLGTPSSVRCGYGWS